MAEYEIQFFGASSRPPDALAADFYDSFEGVLASRCGRLSVTVDATSDAPIDTATRIADRLETLGIHVLRVDPDLVDATEIATRLGRTRQNVQQWATGARQVAFPSPLAVVGGKRIWPWAEIVQWANQHLGFDENSGLLLDEAAIVNANLVNQRDVALLT